MTTIQTRTKRVIRFIRCVETGTLFRTHDQLAVYLEVSSEHVRKKMREDGEILGMRFEYENPGREMPMKFQRRAG